MGVRVLRADAGTWAALSFCRSVVVGLYGQPPWFLLTPQVEEYHSLLYPFTARTLCTARSRPLEFIVYVMPRRWPLFSHA